MTDETAPQRSGTVKWIFCGEQGLRAVWRALLFVAMVFALFVAARPLVNLIAPRPSTGSTPLQADVIREFSFAVLVFVATAVMAMIERRPPYSYGYTDRAGLQRLCVGACWGLLSISALIGALWLHGSLVFDGLSSGDHHAFVNAAASALDALLVGLLEETLLRGYLQFVLTRALGFWWAALTLSLIFGLLHGSNEGETWLGLLGAGVGGLFFCLSLWYTKSLFWAVGFHAGFDWGESYFYGTPDSGQVAPWHVIATHPTGDPLWSGGSAGPEGSFLLVPLLVSLFIGMCIWWGRGRAAFGLRERWT